ncbi:MAG: 2-oxo acid dehydrogenase subunit E2 [Anaerolineae bacterium]|nr:2-oxo acid dehydrogenase subunit E2 [Anaerolineae bacterium]
MVDYMSAAGRKHLIHALIEVDVTGACQYMRDYKARTGESLSFTAFIAGCVAHAVDQDKSIQAYRNWRNQLVIFNDVDVNILVEREAGDRRMGTPYVIRAANTKSVPAIHSEIRAAQAVRAPEFKRVRWYMWLPAFARRLFWRMMLSSPHAMKRTAGTVCITSVGMFGTGAGWGIPLSGYTLQFTLGGIGEKPVIINGELAAREYLCMTIGFDHDIVDGGRAARFTQRVKDLIENSYGLPQIDPAGEQQGQAAQPTPA